MDGNGIEIPKLKFLFVSLESLSGDLAWTIKKEGHEVKAYIKEKDDADVYNGFIDKVDDWKAHVDNADVIVFDDVEFGAEAEKLRKRGKLVVGGSIYTDRLEMDRDFGQNEMKRHGVAILPHRHFSNYDEAIQFMRDNPARYVFKPSGNIPSAGKGLLFIAD
jgi:phosphoribosylamine--glycine ligase